MFSVTNAPGSVIYGFVTRAFSIDSFVGGELPREVNSERNLVIATCKTTTDLNHVFKHCVNSIIFHACLVTNLKNPKNLLKKHEL